MTDAEYVTTYLPSATIGRGWYGLVRRLHEQLRSYWPGVHLTQASETDGVLAITFDHGFEADDLFMEMVRRLSAQICERCGAVPTSSPAPGLRVAVRGVHGLPKTLCDVCYRGVPPLSM